MSVSYVKFFYLTCENSKILYAICMRVAHKISIVLHAKIFNIASKILHAHRMQVVWVGSVCVILWGEYRMARLTVNC